MEKLNRIVLPVILLALMALPGLSQEAKKYNVLFIAVDDLNDWIGPYGGYKGVSTPNIDKLAAEGVVFKKAYCAAPACNPSRTSLLTGIRPSTSGVYHNSQPWRPVLRDAVTLPQHFTANGYKVKGAGKIFHNSYNDPDSWPVYFPVPKSPVPQGAPVYGKAHFDWSPVGEPDEHMGDYLVVDQGITFLQEEHDKPFFLAIGLTRPHLPWYVPQKYFDQYPLDKIVLPNVPDNDLEDVPRAGIDMAKPEGDHKFVVENKQWEKAVQGYLASISFADAQIGRLLDGLRQSKYAENTVIVFFGDHGWHLGEKKHWRKFALWEEAARVPFIVSAPGAARGKESVRTVNLLDIYPTLVELCGLSPVKALEGNSLKSLLSNPEAGWNRPSVTTHGKDNHAVRSERYRYIRYADGSEELYDHEADPGEYKNLASDRKFAAVKNELKKWLPVVNAPDAPVRNQ